MASDAGSDPTVESSETPHGLRSLRGPLSAVGLIVAVDQLTKVWAVAALADGPIDLVGSSVQLHLSRNPGASFSSFQGFTPFLAVAAAVVAVFLVRTVRRTHDRWVLAGLVLVLGGALGNLVDRLLRAPGFLHGEVVDFVRVGGFPVFNVADSAITVGAVLLVLRSLRGP